MACEADLSIALVKALVNRVGLPHADTFALVQAAVEAFAADGAAF